MRLPRQPRHPAARTRRVHASGRHRALSAPALGRVPNVADTQASCSPLRKEPSWRPAAGAGQAPAGAADRSWCRLALPLISGVAARASHRRRRRHRDWRHGDAGWLLGCVASLTACLVPADSPTVPLGNCRLNSPSDRAATLPSARVQWSTCAHTRSILTPHRRALSGKSGEPATAATAATAVGRAVAAAGVEPAGSPLLRAPRVRAPAVCLTAWPQASPCPRVVSRSVWLGGVASRVEIPLASARGCADVRAWM